MMIGGCDPPIILVGDPDGVLDIVDGDLDRRGRLPRR